LTFEQNRELKELIRKNALLNAVKHDGKAQTGAVVGRILGDKATYRNRVKELSVLINEIVQEINSLTLSEQKRIVEEKWPETLLKEKSEEKRLPPLPNIDKYPKVVTRFSPNPDCVLHLGSARAIILCHEYARMHNGKFILRFEDTDPKVKVPVHEFYNRIRQDLTWLNCKPDEEYIQSDRLDIYYEYVEMLIRKGHAYICTCKPEDFRKAILIKKPCPDRNLPIVEQSGRWHCMLDGSYKEGEAVVRVKTDLDHPNPAIRDWPAMRIIDTGKHPHPRVGDKYNVWPLYNLAAGLDDHLLGVTHIIRGKEHLTNMARQEYMYRYLGWEYPEAIHYGRLKITGAYLSKSKIIQGIREGIFKDWDDPRLATFAALRRRGITPEAIRKMIIDVGPKTHDVVLSWENLYAYNRKILDSTSDRYFFVDNPIELKVTSIPKGFDVLLHLHPEHPERGSREYLIEPHGNDKSAYFWVAKRDVQSTQEDTVIRLMELFNIKTKKVDTCSVRAVFESESYNEAKQAKAQLIHWIPVDKDMPCAIIMPDASTVEGIAEAYCRKLKPDNIIQFERFGFVRIDKVKIKLTAYYAQK
jgi:glutamyl-tRNA synthetase